MLSFVSKIRNVFGHQHKKNLIKKFSGVLVVRVVGSVIAFFSHVVLARLMGASEYGAYVYVFSWLMLASLLSRFGLDNYLIRYVSHYVVKKDWHKLKGLLKFSIYSVTIVSIFIGVLSSVLFSSFLSIHDRSFLTFIVAFLIVLPFISLAYLQQSILIGLKHVAISNIPILIFRHLLVIAFIGGIYYYFRSISAYRAMLLTGCAFIFIVAIGFYWIYKRLPYNKIQDVVYEKAKWVKGSLTFLSISAANILNQQGDLVILGFLSTSGQVGIYSASLKIMVLISFASGIVNTLIKPYVSSYFSEKKLEKVEKIMFLSAIFVAFFVIIISIVMIFFGENILALFGKEFTQGYPILLILLMGKGVAVLTGPVSIVLIMTDNHILASKLENIFAAIYIVLTIFLVKVYGAIGAAISTAIIDSTKNITQLYFAKQRTHINTTIFNFKLARQFLFRSVN